jgi:hypothetical protein
MVTSEDVRDILVVSALLEGSKPGYDISARPRHFTTCISPLASPELVLPFLLYSTQRLKGFILLE